MSGIKIGLVLQIEQRELPFVVKPIKDVINNGVTLPDNWVKLILWISEYYNTHLSRVFSLALPKTALNFIEKTGYSPQKNPQPFLEKLISKNQLQPNSEQKKILRELHFCFQKTTLTFRSFLLHGITGSGKTLVYINLARMCLNRGKNVVILIPEIALTSQIVTRFRSQLKEEVHVYHSNLSAVEKREVWKNILNNKARIVLGVRSLILFPIVNTGLIIVDEEHDTSYKQSDTSPRYNARDLALYKGKQLACPVVLGSATPSIESYYNATKGKHKLFQLTKRATLSTLPDILVVDMKKQVELQGDQPISSVLRDSLTKVIAAGEQAILLLNRRGFAKKNASVKNVEK